MKVKNRRHRIPSCLVFEQKANREKEAPPPKEKGIVLASTKDNKQFRMETKFPHTFEPFADFKKGNEMKNEDKHYLVSFT